MARLVSNTFPLFPAQRRVFCAEALTWLRENPAGGGTSVITSLPDLSEIPHLTPAAWREWFRTAARDIMRWIPKEGVAIFYQSDVRLQGTWIDKGYLVLQAAEEVGASLLWHKIVCRKPPGTISPGRPSYSHMLCVAPQSRPPAARPGPDVIPDAGFMPWPRAMGAKAAAVACRYLRDETETRTLVDPFCGEGSLLAVANASGFAAIGVDLSPRRCRIALAQVLQAHGKDSVSIDKND